MSEGLVMGQEDEEGVVSDGAGLADAVGVLGAKGEVPEEDLCIGQPG